MAAQHRAHIPRAGAAVTDPRRVRHPAKPGLPEATGLPTRPRAAVVGGGIAGLSAAAAQAAQEESPDQDWITWLIGIAAESHGMR